MQTIMNTGRNYLYIDSSCLISAEHPDLLASYSIKLTRNGCTSEFATATAENCPDKNEVQLCFDLVRCLDSRGRWTVIVQHPEIKSEIHCFDAMVSLTN